MHRTLVTDKPWPSLYVLTRGGVPTRHTHKSDGVYTHYVYELKYTDDRGVLVEIIYLI